MRAPRLVAQLGALAFGLLASGCTGTGVNAGERGGIAFIIFTVMLLLTGAILAIALGREK